MALQDLLWLVRLVRVQVVDEPGEGDADHVGPGPQTAHLLVLHGVAHLEGGEAGLGGDVPHLAGLVPAGGQQLLAGPVPGEAVYSAGVTREFPLLLRVLPVIQENLPVETAASPEVSVWGISHHLNTRGVRGLTQFKGEGEETHLAVSGVVRLGPLELERRPLVHSGGVVLAARHDTERTAGLEVDGVDGPSLAGDVAVAGPGVGQEDMAVLLPALANHHHSEEKCHLYHNCISSLSHL